MKRRRKTKPKQKTSDFYEPSDSSKRSQRKPLMQNKTFLRNGFLKNFHIKDRKTLKSRTKSLDALKENHQQVCLKSTHKFNKKCFSTI